MGRRDGFLHPPVMTATWYMCNLGDAMLAGEALEEIRAAFASRANRADTAGDMAVFIRHESEGRLHCEVHVYFSPAAGEVAAAFDARACTKPSAQSLGLLAGSEAAREALFPGS